MDFVVERNGVGVPDSDLKWLLIPLGLMRIVKGVRPGRSLGMSGSERSFQSGMCCGTSRTAGEFDAMVSVGKKGGIADDSRT